MSILPTVFIKHFLRKSTAEEAKSYLNIGPTYVFSGTFDFNSSLYQSNGEWLVQTTIANSPYGDSGNTWKLISDYIHPNVYQKAINMNNSNLSLVYNRTIKDGSMGPWILEGEYNDSVERAVNYRDNEIIYRKRLTGTTGNVNTDTTIMTNISNIYSINGSWTRNGGDKFFISSSSSTDVLSSFYFQSTQNQLKLWFVNSAMAYRPYDIVVEYTKT